MRTISIAAGLALASLIFTASVEPADVQKATLVATDYKFTPSTLHATAGQPLELTLINHGSQTHGLRLVFSYGEVPFPENVPPGQTASATFDVGDAGTFRFYCPVEDHAKRGMEGTLIVAPAK